MIGKLSEKKKKKKKKKIVKMSLIDALLLLYLALWTKIKFNNQHKRSNSEVLILSQFYKIREWAEKFIAWSRYFHRMWPNEIYFSTVPLAVHTLQAVLGSNKSKSHQQQIWCQPMNFSAHLYTQTYFESWTLPGYVLHSSHFCL